MLQRFCLWKWLAVGIAVATISAGCLAENDEGKAFAGGGARSCGEGWDDVVISL